ncbi:hypothetical protein Tco_0926104 [Tanacetum coccineum]|uniref:Uncharacterized protein n=1 Tax=Tanacetum coccineum TaxID=301880 RepID=A0ABQ5D8T4_9ASTR
MHGEVISQEYMNQKFLRSLSQTRTMLLLFICVGNKPEIETLSLDDLFNNLKAYESEVKGTSSSTTNSHNVAFLSSSSTNSTTRAVYTAQDNDRSTNQIHSDDREEKDLRWNIAMLIMSGSVSTAQERSTFARSAGHPGINNNRKQDAFQRREPMPVEETTSNALLRTRKVEENLHVKFSKDTPNIARSGPNWLFDIYALTNLMNYKPVVIRNQSNGNADSKSSPDAKFKQSRAEEKKDAKDPGNEDSEVTSIIDPRVNQKKDANVKQCADDLNMPELE